MNNRILIVDDNKSIHDDFRKILLTKKLKDDEEFSNLKKELFDDETEAIIDFEYVLDFASQGSEAIKMVEEAEKLKKPYAVIFMDIRMPPGMDGIQAISEIWKRYPDIQTVICSAYSDYSWNEIIKILGSSDRLLFLKKPFDIIEVQQMALTFVKKWNLEEKVRRYVSDLETNVSLRTHELNETVGELTESKNKLEQEIAIRKNAEKELASEKENLLVTLKNIPDIVITINTEGIITFVNPSTEKFFNLSSDKIIGQNINTFCRIFSEKSKKEIFIEIKEKVILECPPERDAILLYNGIESLVNINCSPITGSENNYTGLLLLIRDITQKRRVEEELLKAKKLESVGNLAGGIAHDFNNILTGITGNLTLSKMFIENKEKSLKYIEIAEQAAFQASKLAQRLLTFARGGNPVKETTSLKDLINELTSFSVDGSNIGSVIETDENLYTVDIDKNQINQVFNNIIENAIHSMPEGGTIKIKAKNIVNEKRNNLPLPDGKYIEISFKDEGHGISKEKIQYIFDPYFTTKKKGNGLGLSVVYSIIKKHNGYVTVDSESGKGSLFKLYLPAIDKLQKNEIYEQQLRTMKNPCKKLLILLSL